MLNNPQLKLFIILIISFLENGNALGFYKPKMVINEFDDPVNWNKQFSPGEIISQRLENELIKKNQFQIIPSGKIQNMSRPKFLDSQLKDKPLTKIPKASTMKDMENQSFMNILLDEPQYRVAKNFQYQRSMEIEPAVNYYKDDPTFKLIQIQKSLNYFH